MPNTRPIIAITSPARKKIISWDHASWLCSSVAIRLAGGNPRRISGDGQFAFDGLLVSGGPDITPAFYGQENTHSYQCDAERDRTELALITTASAQNIPILGICRGAQLLNVALGGDMHQEASAVFRYYTPSKGVLAKLWKRKASYIQGSRWFSRIFNPNEKQWITSLHHQAINRLGTDMIRIADDHHGMTQAIELNSDRFAVGVQWHPEFQLLCANQRAIFKTFIVACRTKKS